jgi:hypothetical protein
MRASFCYLPILPARSGAFSAIAELSPDAVSRINVLFDVPAPVLKNGKTLDTYLTERAQGIHGCWERDRPLYVDVHDLDPNLRTTMGAQPIAFLLNQLKLRGSRAVPVTGTAADRGTDYVNTVRALVAQHPDGVCVRLDRDELSDASQLAQNLIGLLDALSAEPASTDLILDYRYVGREKPEAVRASALDALNVIAGVGQFRNIALAGTSIPDRLDKRDNGKVRRESRVEFEAWSQLLPTLASRMLVAESDYGVVGAHYVTPSGVVTVPSRSRYTTEREHVFRRAKRSEHVETCKQVVASQDYLGETFSAGDRRVNLVAQGQAKPGAPVNWVTDDATHHLEFVSAQVWRILQAQGIEKQFNLAAPSRRPWLQPELIRHL